MKKILNLIAASEKYLHELNVSKYLIEFREKNKLLALNYSELAEKIISLNKTRKGMCFVSKNIEKKYNLNFYKISEIANTIRFSL